MEHEQVSNGQVVRLVNGRWHGGSASERQRAYLAVLARRAELRLDVTSVRDRKLASRLISALEGGGEAVLDVRARRDVFGQAMRLVFGMYVNEAKDPTRHPDFWKDVGRFYQAHLDYDEEFFAGSLGLPRSTR